MSYQPTEQVKQDYIQNKLSPEARTQFEMWLLDHPQVQEDIHLDLMMKAGVHAHQAKQKEVAEKRIAWLPSIGVAAALTVLSSALLLPQLKNESPVEMFSPKVSVLSVMRSSEQPTWELNAGQAQLFQIPVAYLSADSHSVRIEGDVELSLQGLMPSNDMVTVLLPQGALKAGAYQLILTNEVSQEQKQFNLKVSP